VIIHLAAVTSVLASVADPVATHRLNVDATARLLEVARENEVGTFLFASTTRSSARAAASGGHHRAGRASPAHPVRRHQGGGRMLIGSYASCYGMTGASLRFSNVYGPGMAEKDSFIPG